MAFFSVFAFWFPWQQIKKNEQALFKEHFYESIPGQGNDFFFQMGGFK